MLLLQKFREVVDMGVDAAFKAASKAPGPLGEKAAGLNAQIMLDESRLRGALQALSVHAGGHFRYSIKSSSDVPGLVKISTNVPVKGLSHLPESQKMVIVVDGKKGEISVRGDVTESDIELVSVRAKDAQKIVSFVEQKLLQKGMLRKDKVSTTSRGA